jgi:cellulose synthase/poly-beta-1,6-N-acetylglucosamine synthase-like glycosyltransferase
MSVGPMRVVHVDVEAPIPDVAATRAAGGHYTGAFVVVFRGGQPLGHLEVEFGADGLTGARLTERIADELGDVWSLPPPAEPAVPDERLPTISVVIPTTFDRLDHLQRCVTALCRQDYPDVEVIVVDNRPNDSADRAVLWRRLAEDPRVTVVAEPLLGASAARLRGSVLARGEVLSFIDDDAVPAQGWLRAIGRRFALEPETDAVTGLLLPVELETPAQVLFERSGSKVAHRYERVSYQGGPSPRRGGGARDAAQRRGRFEVTAWRPDDPAAPAVRYLVYQAGQFGIGANMSYRAAAFARIGMDVALGAGTPARGGEDLHCFMRLLFAGGRMTFDPAVVAWHSHARELAELREKVYGYGSGFTAILTALIWSDPRHLVGLSAHALRALRLFLRKFLVERGAAAARSYYPAELSRAELRGYAAGPLLYLRSRLVLRRARAALRRASAR